jgi:hypothetical protein
MTGAGRAAGDLVAQRRNAAAALLAGGADSLQAMRQLASDYQLSERQARRYVEQARQGAVEVPVAKAVLTVKVPDDLLRRVRRYAADTDQTLSWTVSRALEQFLERPPDLSQRSS